MPKKHLRQPKLIYSVCVRLQKNKQRMLKFKGTVDSQYIYQKELDKSYFQHDMAYGDFKDLTRRTASDKVLRDKAFNIAKNVKYDGYQLGLASVVYKKASGSGIKNGNISNKKKAEELHKSVIRKLKKKKRRITFYIQYLGC